MEQVLEDLVKASFLRSASAGSFNGIRAFDALLACQVPDLSRAPIAALVAKGRIDCVFTRNDPNPYIKRMPELGRDTQLAWLASEPLESFCLYPSRQTLVGAIGDMFRDMPFSRALALGAAQLEYTPFDLAALGRYRSDPRYSVTFHDYVGHMSISNEAYEDPVFPERDKISVQSFGLGFDEAGMPHIVVFNRYLANLTAEHQQYWNSFAVVQPVAMSEPYYRSTILGDWWENRSVRHAIGEEMRLINERAAAITGKPLFRRLLSDDLPFDLSAFLVPSTDNYAHFVLSWDKVLSDNIDKAFFAGTVKPQIEQERTDGRISVAEKGTLTQLREWLERKVTGSEAAAMIDQILRPLQTIRRERQAPAHRFQKNEFSKQFHVQRRETLWSIFQALTALREVLSRFPATRAMQAPDWLREDGIDVF